MRLIKITFFLLLILLLSFRLNAVEYSWPENGSRLIGERIVHVVETGEHFEVIAKKYNVVFLSLLSANPDVDPFLPVPGSFMKIPRQLILPQVDYEGIVINLAELRLYFFDSDTKKIHVFPIGIGRIGRDTPIMKTRISEKRENPIWIPTANIRKEYLEKQEIVLPLKVLPGPDNPLGTHALRLKYGSGNYLIHGTNKEFGIGLRVSSGCMRMRPEDIIWLYNKVKLNEKVHVVNQPVKINVEPDGAVFVEVHRPLSTNEDEEAKRIVTLADPKVSDWLEQNGMKVSRYRAALAVQSGLPIEIGKILVHP